jgi:phage gp16-like protein
MEDLVNLLTSEKMQKIATSKGSADLNVWQWNEEKALEYMTEKVERLTAEILSKSLARSGNTASLNYVNSTKVSTNDQGSTKIVYKFFQK